MKEKLIELTKNSSSPYYKYPVAAILECKDELLMFAAGWQMMLRFSFVAERIEGQDVISAPVFSAQFFLSSNRIVRNKMLLVEV